MELCSYKVMNLCSEADELNKRAARLIQEHTHRWDAVKMHITLIQ